MNEDNNVAAIVSLSRALADKDAHIKSLNDRLDYVQNGSDGLSKICDEYRAELSKCKEQLIDANMALQSQQARPLADVEEELKTTKADLEDYKRWLDQANKVIDEMQEDSDVDVELEAVKDQLAEVVSQRDELLRAVMSNPRSFVEAIEYLDSVLRFDLHEKVRAVGKVKELTGLSIANASGIVHTYVGRGEEQDEYVQCSSCTGKFIPDVENNYSQCDECKFVSDVEKDKKEGCSGCSGGCHSNRVLVIPDESGMSSAKQEFYPNPIPVPSDGGWHSEPSDDEIPF
jgi:hypothetical protein